MWEKYFSSPPFSSLGPSLRAALSNLDGGRDITSKTLPAVGSVFATLSLSVYSPRHSSFHLAPPLPADSDSQGPITEEIIFRSLITPLHLLSRLSPAKTIFLTPLYFGIAHIHHYYEYKLTNPREATLPALLRSLFQFAYTTLFGWYATFVFIRTGSLAAVVIAHSFCNWCGLPRLWGRVELEADKVARNRITKANEDNGSKYRRDSERGRFQNYISECFAIRWSVAYYVLLLAGAIAFQRGLWPLTESEGVLAQVD